MKVDRWKNCYPSQWKGVIIDRAFEHPAKFSSKLVKRIYDHLIEEGWVKPGDTVLDPFGGVALGAYHAIQNGLDWVGNELELKFHRLGQGMDCPGITKAYWRRYQLRGAKWNELNICPDCASLLDDPGKPRDFMGVYSRTIPNTDPHRFHGNIEVWKSLMNGSAGHAVLLHGDSRELVRVMGDVCEGLVSSPPYVESIQDERTSGIDWSKLSEGGKKRTGSRERYGTGYGQTPGQLSAMPMKGFDASITSPPFLQSEGGTPETKEGGPIDKSLYKRHSAGNSAAEGYGGEEGQLGNMRGSEQGFQGAVSSPPYAESMNQSEGANDTEARIERMRKAGIDVDKKENIGGPAGVARKKQNYGSTPGQLGAMSSKEARTLKASVSSPPFENSMSRDFMNKNARVEYARFHGISNTENVSPIDLDRLKAPDSIYGDTAGNIGNDSGDDFWTAARQIVEQTYALLAPGAHAVWVVRDFVKNKERVPFSDQWRQLCEAVGFETLHEHHAMLVHHKGTQETLFGEPVEIKTESKSFFRRLSEKKGSPRIDWETVYCMVKNP
jgi:hypothetical protein